MKVALVNPPWSFPNSIYFGCRDPHLPLELGYAKALLEQNGHEALLVDGHLQNIPATALADRVAAFAPDMTVIVTAPTYLFWRCAQPELRAPREIVTALSGRGGFTVAVGPHGSATPAATLRKLGVELVVRGECEEAILALAETESSHDVHGVAWLEDGELRLTGGLNACGFVDLPALSWPESWISRHAHHHHRFERKPEGPGAEVEASRGCPYSCSFCAKLDFRDKYRRRNHEILLREIDGLLEQGVRYLYFIDEIFLPQKPLLEVLRDRDVAFGVQTRLDLWKPEMIDLLGEAGCVSVEAGVESLTEEGRALLQKKCRMTTEELTDLLIRARRKIPFVQANLIATDADDPAIVAEWRKRLEGQGVWANDPVPLYPYPSSPDYRRLWGEPDDYAWERAHTYYLAQFDRFSDVQDAQPHPLPELEDACLPAR
ncbi:TIGR04295 family B12-binding domain-containing radical SAM protein [Inquilinus sp. CAU 1745]|uniref:TIGR04295 family B12-binding domain-containing radical SAM protein n=1 Tax=Inquilinus sp. CAU 1745 TaxID=3140369 RepID=UPI00325B1F22